MRSNIYNRYKIAARNACMVSHLTLPPSRTEAEFSDKSLLIGQEIVLALIENGAKVDWFRLEPFATNLKRKEELLQVLRYCKSFDLFMKIF